MKRFGIAVFCCLLMFVGGVQATSVEEVPTSGDADTSDLWNRTREQAGDWWQRSREAMGEAWDSTRGLFQTQEDDTFALVWESLLPKLEDTLELQERQAGLPESAWLREDQKSNQADINRLLDEAVEILSTSGVDDYRERIRALQIAIEEANQAIAEYRRQRVTAPEESMVQKTVADYDRAIEEKVAAIHRDEQALSEIKREFAGELRGMGLELSDEQVSMLLATVVGDNIIDLGIVFDNVKAVTVQLEKLVEESGEDLQNARRYYGLYVILLKSFKRMHRQIERAIDGLYIPQIDTIVTRARALTAETRALQRQSPEKAELLAANLEAQQLTIQAAGVYRQYLVDQAAQVRQARQELSRDIAAAWNTYETVRVSGELVQLFKASHQLLDGLLDRQVPELRPFQNMEMKREFEKLTEQLRAAADTP